jgi:4,5-dihydroxyphthalate decarboxylase
MERFPCLTYGGWSYDRNLALQNGQVKIEGVELNYVQLRIEELFYRVFHHREFDIAEMSLSAYMMAIDKGPWEYQAVPVFLSRMFRHSAIFVRTDRGIREPKDLIGKRIGVPEYTQTAGVTARGILQDEYGVTPADIRWVNGGLEDPGRHEKFPLELPPGVIVESATKKSLNQMLAEGEIDGIISASTPPCFERGDPNVVRLFSDHQAKEKAWFAKTGVFPIMHTVGIRRSLVERHPWLAASVVKAFTQSKNACLADIYGTGGALKASVPWLVEAVEEARALMGADHWPYGIAKNRAALEAVARWSNSQGLTSKVFTPESLFPPSTHGEFKI